MQYDIPLAYLRTDYVYGPLQDRAKLIPTAIRAAQNDLVLPVPPVSGKRDYVHICDVVSACCRAATESAPNLPIGAGGYVAMNGSLAGLLVQSTNPRFYLAGLIGHFANAIDAIPMQRHFRDRGKSAYNSNMRLATGISNVLCVLTERYWYDPQ